MAQGRKLYKESNALNEFQWFTRGFHLQSTSRTDCIYFAFFFDRERQSIAGNTAKMGILACISYLKCGDADNIFLQSLDFPRFFPTETGNKHTEQTDD